MRGQANVAGVPKLGRRESRNVEERSAEDGPRTQMELEEHRRWWTHLGRQDPPSD